MFGKQKCTVINKYQEINNLQVEVEQNFDKYYSLI